MAIKEIWFKTLKNGSRRAWTFNIRQLRAFPMPLAEAELLIATGQAREIPGHPLQF